MITMHSISQQYGGLQTNNRFAVRIIPTGYLQQKLNTIIVRDLTYLCELGDMPGRGFITVDLRYYGPNQKLPTQASYDDLTLGFICRKSSFEREFFDDWHNIINPTNTFDFAYRDDYSCKIELFQMIDLSTNYDESIATYKLNVHNAYPLTINPQPMNWADNNFQKINVTFTYTHFTRDKDPDPRMNGLVDGPDVTVTR